MPAVANDHSQSSTSRARAVSQRHRRHQFHGADLRQGLFAKGHVSRPLRVKTSTAGRAMVQPACLCRWWRGDFQACAGLNGDPLNERADPVATGAIWALQSGQSERGSYQRSLPVLHHEFSLRQALDFPCLTAATIPIDLGVARATSRSARLRPSKRSEFQPTATIGR